MIFETKKKVIMEVFRRNLYHWNTVGVRDSGHVASYPGVSTWFKRERHFQKLELSEKLIRKVDSKNITKMLRKQNVVNKGKIKIYENSFSRIL